MVAHQGAQVCVCASAQRRPGPGVPASAGQAGWTLTKCGVDEPARHVAEPQRKVLRHVAQDQRQRDERQEVLRARSASAFQG